MFYLDLLYLNLDDINNIIKLVPGLTGYKVAT